MENSLLIMEHYYDFTKSDFIRFSTESSPFTYVKGMAYSSIFVPTIDTLRYSFVLDILLNARKNVYVTGETGTGKTAIIQNKIKSLLATEEWTMITMNFSAQTTSEETQKSLESNSITTAKVLKIWRRSKILW